MIGSITQVQQEMLAAEKRKRRRDNPERTGRDLADDVPAVASDAHEAAQAGLEATRDEAARKTYQDRGAVEGPGHLMQPGMVGPEQFGRPYMESGHAAKARRPGHRGRTRCRRSYPASSRPWRCLAPRSRATSRRTSPMPTRWARPATDSKEKPEHDRLRAE